MNIARIAVAATALVLLAGSAEAASHHHHQARHYQTAPSVTVGSFDQGLGYGLLIMLRSQRGADATR